MLEKGFHIMALDTAQHSVTETYAAINVRPLSIHIGAEIDGVDLTRPLSPEAVHDIRAALVHWKVEFFREQQLDQSWRRLPGWCKCNDCNWRRCELSMEFSRSG